MLKETIILHHKVPKAEIKKIIEKLTQRDTTNMLFIDNGTRYWDNDGRNALVMVSNDKRFDDMKYEMYEDFDNNFMMIKQKKQRKKYSCFVVQEYLNGEIKTLFKMQQHYLRCDKQIKTEK